MHEVEYAEYEIEDMQKDALLTVNRLLDIIDDLREEVKDKEETNEFYSMVADTRRVKLKESKKQIKKLKAKCKAKDKELQELRELKAKIDKQQALA